MASRRQSTANLEQAGQIGPYRLLSPLGTGGMATVHLAEHRESGHKVALKRLLPHLAHDSNLTAQFEREARIAMELRHANIVAVTDYGVDRGVQYLAMEHIVGRSLLDLLRQSNQDGQAPPIGVTLWLVHQVLSALDYAMRGCDSSGAPHRIVHRDLSPSNILVTDNAEIKIIDFGVAKSLQGRFATNSGRIKGKLGYMSPETLAGRTIDSRSDIFSLAVVTWELLTAQRLFRGTETQQLALRAQSHQRTPPSRFNRWVPEDLDDVLAKALSEDPNTRYVSAYEMLSALAPLLERQASGASRQALRKWLRQLRVGAGVLDSSQTMHALRIAPIVAQGGSAKRSQSKPPPIPPRRSGASAVAHIAKRPAVPGVKRFVDGVATTLDPVPDPAGRHRAATEEGEVRLARGSSEFPAEPSAESWFAEGPLDPVTVEELVLDAGEAVNDAAFLRQSASEG